MSFWERYARMGLARAALVIGVALGAAGLCWTSLGALRIDTRLEALLPTGTPTQRALDQLRARAASDALFTVLITSEDPALNRRLAPIVAKTMEGWEETRWATARRDISALTDSAALYLDTKTLEVLAEDMQALVDWEYCERMPGCVNFFDRPELPTKDELVEKLAASPSGKALSAYTGENLTEMWRRHDAKKQAGDGGKDDDDSLMCADDGSVCAVQASLDGSASNLQFARGILSKAETMFAQLRPADAPASLRMVTSGRYRNAPMEQTAIESDLQRTTLVSTALILLLLTLQFRGARAIVLLLLPLGISVLLTLGILSVVHPQLNLISAFTLAILAGVGVDFGIHLLTHYGSDRAAGKDVQGALGHTLHALFGSLLAAGATTGCAFVALSASNFRGIAQMGWMAGLGVTLSLAAFLFLFPPTTRLADRLRPERGALVRRTWLRGVPLPSRRAAVAVSVTGVLLGVACAVLSSGVRLETNFRKLQAPSISTGVSGREALRGTSGLSVYLMADTPQVLATTATDLIERNFDGFGGEKGSLLLAPSVLLPEDQPARLAALADIRASLSRLAKRVGDEKIEDIDALRRWVDVDKPLTPQSLPASVRESLSEQDGSFGKLGVLYMQLRGYDANAMEELSHDLDVWRERYPGMTFASPSAMLGEVVPALRSDALTIVGLALLGLTVASAMFGRSVRRTLLVLAPVLLAMVCSAGVMALWGLRINLYNVLVLPVAFGVGVDGAVYVVWSTSEAPDLDAFWARYKVAAQAVLGSSLTSMVAFGSIALAHNPGLASLGELALLTIGLALVANLVWLPCLLLARARGPAAA